MTKWITPKQAMEMLGVGPTTIKRWADENRLSHFRTAGGHRRFDLLDIDRMLDETSEVTSGDLLSTDQWLDWLTGKADVAFIRREVERLKSELGDWFAVAGFLGELLNKLGVAWSENEVSVFEEHVASGLINQALDAVSVSIGVPKSAPVCLLATLTGEQHTLGISLLQPCLRSAGFGTVFAGANTPVKELVDEINNSPPVLLALSASSWATDSAFLARAYRHLSGVCEKRRTQFVYGGEGAWPDMKGYGYRCRSFEDFRSILNRLELNAN